MWDSHAGARRPHEWSGFRVPCRACRAALAMRTQVDSLLGRRSSGGLRDSMPDKRVTNEFLAFIDGIQTAAAAATAGAARGGGGGGGGGGVGAGPSYGGSARIVVIAATNCPWDLDEAALSRCAADALQTRDRLERCTAIALQGTAQPVRRHPLRWFASLGPSNG